MENNIVNIIFYICMFNTFPVREKTAASQHARPQVSDLLVILTRAGLVLCHALVTAMTSHHTVSILIQLMPTACVKQPNYH